MRDNTCLRVSVVTPTLRRTEEVAELLDSLAAQTHPIFELVLVDAAPAGEDETQNVVEARRAGLPFTINYIRRGGGTAIQRNIGIDAAQGDYVAFIDDDIRLEPNYFELMMEVYAEDTAGEVGGIAGYVSNQYFSMAKSDRWKWYRKLKLFTTYEPGRYDYVTGYPINRYTQPPHEGVREIDFMGSNCGVWRKKVMDEGLRFSAFFVGYGVLEDAHFALRARRTWKLLECGRAKCRHLHSPRARENKRRVANKTAVNYRFVFMDIVPKRTRTQEFRFWRVQLFDLFRITMFALRKGGKANWQTALGKFEGILEARNLKQAHVDELSNQPGA
jgi:glycosyltransferase involved in cell wall biosynthesis